MIDKYNALLREKYGEDITVEIKSYIEDNGGEWYYYTSARYGDSDNAFKSIKEAYNDASTYLSHVGELW